MTHPRPDPASLWLDTALTGPVLAPMPGDQQCDVAIIGGGYTGLSAARHLAAKGLDPIVLEANRIGWGGSGRNGGVVMGKFRLSFADIAAGWGVPMARRMADLSHEAVDLVGELVAHYDITRADFRVSGNLRCAHNDVSLAKLRTEQAWLADTLGDTSFTLLSREAVAHETGSQDFVGGLLNAQGGLIHPMEYVRGLARGVLAEGVRIFEASPVLRMRPDDTGMLLETPNGVIRARQVVIATNAYSDQTPVTADIRHTLVPFRSAMIATAPLTDPAFAPLLPTGRSYSETRRMMRWFRRAGDRIIFGGRGAFGKDDSSAAFDALQRKMIGIFPVLKDVAITHRWSGLVGMTMDSVPHVGRINDRISYAVGYNGTGIAMSTLMGRYLADIVQGAMPDMGLLWSPHLKKVPFYSVREPAVRLVAGWYQFLDAIGR